jgi:hypothetical protein
MLGITHKIVYCDRTYCRHNEKHVVRDMKDKIIERYHTCKKDVIEHSVNGVCLTFYDEED